MISNRWQIRGGPPNDFPLQPRPASSRVPRSSRGIDALRLDDLMAANIETLCAHFFPEGRRVSGQWRVASIPRTGTKKNRPGSLAINLEGPYADSWYDWSDKSRGMFIGLLLKKRLVPNLQAALVAIERCLSEHQESSRPGESASAAHRERQ
jgi:hypothetical protein